MKRVVERTILFDVSRTDFLPCQFAVLMKFSLKVEVKCPMDFQHYPFDTQTCPFILYVPDFELLFNRFDIFDQAASTQIDSLLSVMKLLH